MSPGHHVFELMALTLVACPLSSTFAPSFLMRRSSQEAASLPKRRTVWLARRTA